MPKLPSFTKIRLPLLTWALTLFGLTAVAVVWLLLSAVNPFTDFSPAIILIAYSPSLAALLAAGFVPGAGGLGALLRQLLIWRVGIRWYVLGLLGPLALVLAAIAIYALLGGSVPAQWLVLPTAGTLGSMVGPLIAGSLGEELGWRGFAQPLLQKRYNLLLASVIVGVLWATWHLWPVLAPGGTAQIGLPEIAETYARLIATAVIYGWIYVRTGGSVLLVMLAHAGHNIAIGLLPGALLNAAPIPLLVTCLYVLSALALVVARPTHFLRPAKAS